MKKILISSLLFFSLGVNAQTDTTEIQTDSVEVQMITLPDSTAIGAPDGKLVSKELGPAGGKIVSEDGRVELNFPEGALSANTTISIQPIVNLLPNGNGKAYQFEPSGIQFKKPVQIIFHYKDEEAETCPPEFKFMALQNHKGKWEYTNYEEWDSTTKSLKGFISHFSAYVDGNEVELNKTEITLKVGKTHRFALNVVSPPLAPDAPGQDELPHLPRTINRGNREELWKVNEVTGGSAKHGSIIPVRGHSIKATYKAPAVLIADSIIVKLALNQTTIREVVQRSRGAARRWVGTTRIPTTSNVATFTCKVNLYDEYKVTVSQDFEVDDDVRMTDTSIFLLRIGIEERASMSGIINQLAKLHIRQSGCQAIYVNASTCVGMINVTGIRTSNVMPTPNGFARVDIFFSPASFLFPVVHFPPCGVNRQPITTPPTFSPYAFPMWLGFEAKNEKQYISLGTGEAVRRPDPEDITATIEPIRE